MCIEPCSMVEFSDIHPADKKNPDGKLRLLYEAAPMSFLIEQAGGLALTGKNRIMDIPPTSVHQRVPCIRKCMHYGVLGNHVFMLDYGTNHPSCNCGFKLSVGSRDDVLELRRYYQERLDPELIARCAARLTGEVNVMQTKVNGN